MIGLMTMLAANTVQAQSCLAVSNPGDQVQVAWISPLSKRVFGNGGIEVVPVSDLRHGFRSRGRNLVCYKVWDEGASSPNTAARGLQNHGV